MDQVLLGILERGVHAGELFSHRSHVIASCSLRRESGHRHLDRAACFEHLGGREAVQSGHQPKRTAVEGGRPVVIDNEGARPLPGLQHPVCSQRADARAQRRTAYTEKLREVPFGRQPVTTLQLSTVDQFAEVQHDFLRTGAALVGFNGSKSRSFQIGHTNAVNLD